MKKILIIEDNEDSKYLFKFLLEENGFEVVLAASGEAGLKLAREEKPDLVIMDIMLPDISAEEVMINLQETLGGAPIVAVTAYTLKGDREQFLSMGLAGYIQKPIDPGSFIGEIRGFLSSRSNPRYRNI